MDGKIDETLKYSIKKTILEREKRKLELREDDEHYHMFVDLILPSCLFHWISDDRVTYMYKCPFIDCSTTTLKSYLAKKHLLNHHSNVLPTSVFDHERCVSCNAGPFSSKQNLNNHLRSKRHAMNCVRKGIANAEEMELYERDKRSKELKKLNKKKQHSVINTLPVTQAIHPRTSISINNVHNDTYVDREYDAIMKMFNPTTFGEELMEILMDNSQNEQQNCGANKKIFREMTNQISTKSNTKK